MMKMSVVRYLSAALTMLYHLVSVAQSDVVAYYNAGHAGTVTFAAAPVVLKDLSGNHHDLAAAGSPLFFADAPAEKKSAGEGSILLKGDASYRSLADIAPGKQFILEAWVKTNSLHNNDDHAGTPFSAVSLGGLHKGYNLAQQGGNWMVITDGRRSDIISPVSVRAWIHLALVVTDREVTLFADGERKGTSRPSRGTLSSLSIGDAGTGGKFNGLIYAVRLTKIATAARAASRFLINREKLQRDRREKDERQGTLIRKLAANPLIETVSDLETEAVKGDWLIDHVTTPVRALLKPATDGKRAMLELTNGLVSRTFLIAGNIACVSMKQIADGSEYVRAIKPEGRIMIDSNWYSIGGLSAQPEKAYLLESWYPDLAPEPGAFRFNGLDIQQPATRYPWQQKFNAVAADWPPKGLHIIMHYQPTDPGANGIEVLVHYEMYVGMPVIRKWITAENRTHRSVVVNRIESELLAVTQDHLGRLQAESDYSFAAVNNTPEASGSTLYPSSDINDSARFGHGTTQWRVDPEYTTWATHNPQEDLFLHDPHVNMLVSTLPVGPAARVPHDSTFVSFSTFELLHDTDDPERQSLAHRRLYRRLAPQVTESQITGGITSNDPATLKKFISQMAELGFERLDVMAWPGVAHDNLDSGYIAMWKDVADYARARNIVVGGYELQVASRGRGAAYDCIDRKTGKPGSFFGQSVCIASAWQDIYYPKMWQFFDRTGLMSLNVDGPYHGDACASTTHPHHGGYYDSQWEQWKFQTSVVHELQRRNMYAPMPDWYFLNGQAATGMGYREASANLTPQQQLLLGRQYIYDGTRHKTPTMGWMTLQLVGFYSDDPSIGLEPLAKNLGRYETALFQLLASGAQLTVRGNRLYDSPETKTMVSKWVTWFRKYRPILTSDIIHFSRPTGRDVDVILHVNPDLDIRGMAIVFNPTDSAINKTVRLPLYYTGLKGAVNVAERDSAPKRFAMSADGAVDVPVSIPAGGFTWITLKDTNMTQVNTK